MKFIKWLIALIKNFFTKKLKEEKKPEEVISDVKYDVIINNDPPQFDFDNDWVVENEVCNVENNCLKVIYREKYGAELIAYCMVVFKNDKTQQYKLVAPWLKNEVIERSNITGILVAEVPKSERQ